MNARVMASMVEQKLNQVLDGLTLLKQRGDIVMTGLEEVLKRLDLATNQVAERLRLEAEALDAAIKAGKVAEASAVARLNELANRLETLAADPKDPVPVVKGK